MSHENRFLQTHLKRELKLVLVAMQNVSTLKSPFVIFNKNISIADRKLLFLIAYNLRQTPSKNLSILQKKNRSFHAL